jgi:hypothetical protein
MRHTQRAIRYGVIQFVMASGKCERNNVFVVVYGIFLPLWFFDSVKFGLVLT